MKKSSDELHFEVHGHKVMFVCKSSNEVTSSSPYPANTKTSSKENVLGLYAFQEPGPLVPIKGMTNSDKYISLLQRRIVSLLQKLVPVFQQELTFCIHLKNAKKILLSKCYKCSSMAW